MKKQKNTIYLCEIAVMPPDLASHRIDEQCVIFVCFHARNVFVCVCVCLAAHFCTTIDGASKSSRQAKSMPSVCNIRLSILCVRVCERECLNGEDRVFCRASTVS